MHKRLAAHIDQVSEAIEKQISIYVGDWDLRIENFQLLFLDLIEASYASNETKGRIVKLKMRLIDH